LGIVVPLSDAEQMITVTMSLEGQLTSSLQMDSADLALARRLLPILKRRAGRVLVKGFPTGVEVSDTMVHGAPLPATTNFGTGSIGSLSVRRFLRPVCYQSFPAALLPPDLSAR
jgi:2,5-dioxopentanoate dehydrogenase